MPLHETLNLLASSRSIPFFDVIGDVAVEQIVDEGRIEVGPALGYRVLSIAHRVQNPTSLGTGTISCHRAVLAKRRCRGDMGRRLPSLPHCGSVRSQRRAYSTGPMDG